MIIENPDAFKSWLTSILEPLCDADPAALAKYVYALVKKDKPLDELREGMLDQLDVFLQQETKPFVDMLFKALENNEYLKLMEKAQLSAPPAVPSTEQKEPEKEPEIENHTVVSNGASSPLANMGRARSPNAVPAPPPRHRLVVCRSAKPPPQPQPQPQPQPLAPLHPHPPHPPREHTLVKVMPLTELLEEPVDQPPRRRDRRENMREERRRRRSRSWERRARARRHPHARDDLPPDARRRTSRSPSPRGRFRNRSPPLALDRPASRSRSRSPVPIREREHDRDRLRPPREMERDRMSRDREHRERASRSRDRERSRSRSRSASPGPRHARDLPDHFKRRCRDFDEKGYCMRGDLCQWDHGADPVVLEDAALTSVLSMPPPVQEYNPLAPDIWCGAPYPPYAHPPPHAPPRELIPIPRLHESAPAAGPPAAPRLPVPQKKNFDYNRLGRSGAGAGRTAASNGANCSLEVKKVPRGLNDITHLNNHFGKFGKIVNIQVCYEGDPEAALITFSNHTEANVAYKSTEAVLNNRFIKVFWHNPENKQENTAPSGQQKPTNPQQPTSHNKVLINRENIKATADNKATALAAEKAKEALANGTDKKEPSKPLEKSKQVMEMHKRAQALLQTQLQQQVLLIQRLEGGNVTGPQRAVLLEAINSAQEGIEKLRKELVAYNRTLKLMQANAKKPKSREEAQKEILDAELDMFTKQQEGQDVTDIQKKIAELRRQMAMQFPVHPAMRRPHSRGGRFNTMSRFTRAPQFLNQSVDHRPRALLVSGFEADEAQALQAHFAQFGEIASAELNPQVPELVVVYRARAHAELAAQQGRHYNDRTLTITWVANSKAFSNPPRAADPRADPPESAKDTEHQQTAAEAADALLRFDEEDEEEEDRSWRR